MTELSHHYKMCKASIYRWRENYPEKYKTNAKRSSQKQYAWKKVCRQFRHILIDELPTPPQV